MRPAARVSAVAEILDALDWERSVEPQLKAWERANRYAGSKDRRAIADHVYACLRRRGTLTARMASGSGRALALGALVDAFNLSVDEIAALCDGSRHAPEPLTNDEQDALSAAQADPSLDWPDFLREDARVAFGADFVTEMRAMQDRAPLDLRVNTLKTTREDARSALRDEGIETAAHPLAATVLRVTGDRAVTNTGASQNGLIEPQDAASQAVAMFSEAAPGMTVLDACAGAGGKTLALSAMMQGQGALYAYDVESRRMADLPKRAARAGATVNVISNLEALHERCDVILVDAPCSGSGSWRRDPLGKWRLTPERLVELEAAQREALAMAIPLLKTGGILVYATCSILPRENENRIAEFCAANPRFSLQDALRLHPARDGGDGFYAAKLSKG